MSNSLNFLNKPTATPKPAPYGPQPKPSTAAPKAAFLDRSNPWAVGGGTPTASAKTPARQPAPRTQTPAPTPQRAAIPSRGYNYTDASNTGATPQQRAREVDQAQMAAQATRQRREREQAQAQAAQAQTIAPVQARGYVDPYLAQQQRGFPTPQPTPQPRIDPYLAQQQGLAQPTPAPASPWQMAPSPEQLMAMRPMGQPTPAPAPAQPWQMAPTAEQAMAVRPQPAPGQPAAPIVPTNAWLLDGIQPGQPAAPAARQNAPAQPSYNPLPQGTGTNVPTAPGTPNAPAAGNAAQPQARGPFYGYAPPGPLTAPRTVETQRGQRMPYYMTDRPNVSGWGQRALMTDEALAVEDARRQRDAAGSFGALQASGRYRPWSSYSPAEKYYLRYGVMPEGAQLAPDTSGAEALAANEAQNQRLYDEYWDRYGNVIRGRRWYGGTRPGQEQTMYGSEMAAAMQGRAQPAGTQAAPATTTTAATPAQAAQIAKNNQIVMQINPQAATTGVTDEDANAAAREIVKRYMPDKDVSTLTLAEIGAILAMSYTPPPGLEQQFGYDMDWLTQLLPSE